MSDPQAKIDQLREVNTDACILALVDVAEAAMKTCVGTFTDGHAGQCEAVTDAPSECDCGMPALRAALDALGEIV